VDGALPEGCVNDEFEELLFGLHAVRKTAAQSPAIAIVNNFRNIPILLFVQSMHKNKIKPLNYLIIITYNKNRYKPENDIFLLE
jgi:hypothetical protein